MYLHKDVYQPDKYLFTGIDTAAIREYTHLLSKGGIPWVLQVPQRTLNWFYDEALGLAPNWPELEDTYVSRPNDRKSIIDWLEENGLYAQGTHDWSGERLRYVDRVKLARRLSVDEDTLRGSPKFAALLRQYEPDLLAISNKLLIPVRGIRGSEFPLHTTPLIKQSREDNYNAHSVQTHLGTWKNILKLHQSLPQAIPDSREIDVSSLRSMVRSGKDNAHTPWVPLKTALAYTREALRWVAEYEDPLIDFYINAVVEFQTQRWFSYQENSVGSDMKLAALRDKWVKENCPPELAHLNIRSWTSWFSKNQPRPFEALRSKPGLNDAMQVLMGAIAVLIGITKPIRLSELLRLRRECVKFVDGDGFWIEQLLGKANVGHAHLDIARPIPSITARAIQGLKKLADNMSRLTCEQDELANRTLFFLPGFVRDASLGAGLTAVTDLSRFLNRFCDYVALPPDKYGRRWYIRVHEMRKSFLITFFWCYRFASLDAARWIAGHTTVEQIYAYIEANFPGDELPALEAEYAAEQLWDFHGGEPGEPNNVAALYRSVCQHFGVKEINLVPEAELTEWLRIAFKKGLYRVVPYSVKASDGSQDVVIAFRISRLTDNT